MDVFWYCAKCAKPVPPVSVTYWERHTECGEVVSVTRTNADPEAATARQLSVARELAAMNTLKILTIIPMAGNFSAAEMAAFAGGVRRAALHILEAENNGR